MTSTENQAAPAARFEGGTGPGADAGVDSDESQKHIRFVRQLLSEDIDETKLMIRGPGVKIGIDECKFAKRK